MTIYQAESTPAVVRSGTRDPEIAEWLKTEPPPVGHVEFLGIRRPHGTIPVRVYHPFGPARQQAGRWSIFMAASRPAAT